MARQGYTVPAYTAEESRRNAFVARRQYAQLLQQQQQQGDAPAAVRLCPVHGVAYATTPLHAPNCPHRSGPRRHDDDNADAPDVLDLYEERVQQLSKTYRPLPEIPNEDDDLARAAMNPKRLRLADGVRAVAHHRQGQHQCGHAAQRVQPSQHRHQH